MYIAAYYTRAKPCLCLVVMYILALCSIVPVLSCVTACMTVLLIVLVDQCSLCIVAYSLRLRGKMRFVRLSVFCVQWSVYIHRHATIVETSHRGVPQQEMPRRRFTFSSLADVRAFWNTLRSESLNTPAGLLLLVMLIVAVTNWCSSALPAIRTRLLFTVQRS